MRELIGELSHIGTLNAEYGILLALSLIDLSLTGNLLLIVMFSGCENFVSKIETENHEDRPSWMGTVDFSGLKLKLIASIVAISGIALLRSFLTLGDPQTAIDPTRRLDGRHSPDIRGLRRPAGRDGLAHLEDRIALTPCRRP